MGYCDVGVDPSDRRIGSLVPVWSRAQRSRAIASEILRSNNEKGSLETDTVMESEEADYTNT
jgi:hypothetical protein